MFKKQYWSLHREKLGSILLSGVFGMCFFTADACGSMADGFEDQTLPSGIKLQRNENASCSSLVDGLVNRGDVAFRRMMHIDGSIRFRKIDKEWDVEKLLNSAKNFKSAATLAGLHGVFVLANKTREQCGLGGCTATIVRATPYGALVSASIDIDKNSFVSFAPAIMVPRTNFVPGPRGGGFDFAYNIFGQKKWVSIFRGFPAGYSWKMVDGKRKFVKFTKPDKRTKGYSFFYKGADWVEVTTNTESRVSICGQP